MVLAEDTPLTSLDRILGILICSISIQIYGDFTALAKDSGRRKREKSAVNDNLDSVSVCAVSLMLGPAHSRPAMTKRRGQLRMGAGLVCAVRAAGWVLLFFQESLPVGIPLATMRMALLFFTFLGPWDAESLLRV
ncbi:hypothetical protein CB1_000509005 [Camelus ferus]|nr:hypothetical protein CB1_000509005 [Camelus ferus]